MRRSCGGIVRSAGVGALLLALSVPGHQAGAVGLQNTSVLTLDHMTATVGSCVYTLNGVTQASCGTNNAELIATLGGTYMSMTVDKAGGGVLWDSIQKSVANPNPSFEIAFTLTLARDVGNTTAYVTSDAATLFASQTGGPASNLDLITASNTNLPSPAASINLTGSSPGPIFSGWSTQASNFTYNVDMKLDATNIALGNTLTLNRLVMQLKPAPEPASVGIFLVGLAGLRIMRRGRNRRRSAA